MMNKEIIKLNRSDLVRCKKELPINVISLYDFKKENFDAICAAHYVVFVDGKYTKTLKSRF